MEPGKIGIRREDKNIWERRAPLSPKHVKALVDQGLQVVVQPSSLRCFSNWQYKKAGAIIQEDLSDCSLIMAVKEVPIELLLPNRTYIFFSHTIKAQPYNMPLLDAILDKKIRLFDYEPIKDEESKRLVKFGPFAGLAGAIDSLHALGERLLYLGFSTPFLFISFSKFFASLDIAFDAVKHAGEMILDRGLPEEILPLVFTCTSNGSVSKGAQEVLQKLPHKYVTVEELPTLEKDPHLVYICEAKHYEYIVKSEDGSFDREDYYANPELYESKFHERVLPYTSVLLNCMYWDPRYPKIATLEQMKKAKQENLLKLLVLGDITCDPNGSVEIFVRSTPIDNPVYAYDLDTDETTPDGASVGHAPGIVVMGVDHLPAELPIDATNFFGDSFVSFVKNLAESDMRKPWGEQGLVRELEDACIAWNGHLTPNFEYIAELRARNEEAAASEEQSSS